MDSQTDDWVGARDGYYLSWVFNALKDLQGKGIQVEGQVWLNVGLEAQWEIKEDADGLQGP